jgi:hypothetical protein
MDNLETDTESVVIGRELTLYEPSGTPLAIQVLELRVKNNGGICQGCRLIAQVSYQLYEYIVQAELFNLVAEAKLFPANGSFLPDFDVQLELELLPDLLPKLSEHCHEITRIFHELESLEVASDFSGSLKGTDSWYCLSVKQQQETAEVGYRTLWDYMNLGAIASAVSAGNQIAASLSNFIEASADSIGEKLQSESQSDNQSGSSTVLEWLQLLNQEEDSPAVSEVVRDYFNEEEWEFVKLDEEEEVFQVKYEGANGLWSCYAYANDEASELMFYSICPMAAPPEKLLLIAEFLSRANFGLKIGNFELDFEDGEIRYKTSIDVENDRLSVALVRNLVYCNLQTMDKYLPGIIGVMNNLSPEEAIARVESKNESEGE